MRWLSILATGLITGTLGAILAAFVADGVATYRHVSNFEGGRLYLVALVFVPLGFLTGLGTGLWLGSLSTGGLSDWTKQLALAAAVTGGIIALVGGLVFAVSEHAPTIDGKKLMLEIEVLLPVSLPPSESFEASLEKREIAAGLHMGTRESRGVSFTLTKAAVGERDGHPVVPGTVLLYHASADRVLGVAFRGDDGETVPTQNFAVPLPARPGPEQMVWSPWAAPYSTDGASPDGTCEVRFRVQPAPN